MRGARALEADGRAVDATGEREVLAFDDERGRCELEVAGGEDGETFCMRGADPTAFGGPASNLYIRSCQIRFLLSITGLFWA